MYKFRFRFFFLLQSEELKILSINLISVTYAKLTASYAISQQCGKYYYAETRNSILCGNQKKKIFSVLFRYLNLLYFSLLNAQSHTIIIN